MSPCLAQECKLGQLNWNFGEERWKRRGKENKRAEGGKNGLVVVVFPQAKVGILGMGTLNGGMVWGKEGR